MQIPAEIFITMGGIFNLGFAAFHLFFWKIFHWKDDLASLTHINRSVMQILNLCLILLFLIMAYVSFLFPAELASTKLGRVLAASFSLFWFLRTTEQIIFFGVRRKISLALTLVFLAGGFLYLLPVLDGSHG